MPATTRHVLVLGDSLTYLGPEPGNVLTDPRLFPNVMAGRLEGEVAIDLLARLGWGARDAWWALTKDPRSWGQYVPRADALVLAVGGFDQLPAVIPSYAREGMAYLRPGGLRRSVRRTYHRVAPPLMRATDGRLRQLPQAATDRYLARCLEAVWALRPGIPVVLVGPSPYDSALYPAQRPHPAAVRAARAWASEHGTGFVDLDPLVTPHLRAGRNNPDGLHWGWETHAEVGEALAHELTRVGWGGACQPRPEGDNGAPARPTPLE